MAARLRPRHQDEVRTKIQASQLVTFLQNHALKGKNVKNISTRIKAAEILLGKTIPNLASTSISGPDGGPIEVALVSAAELRSKVRGS